MAYVKEEKWAFTYEVNGYTKVCYPKSKAQVAENRAVCKKRGYKVVSVVKLYPFSTNRNQHNFDLIHSICSCRIHDITVMGKAEEYEGELARLQEMDELAQEFFCLPLPVAWLPWDMHCKAKELANMAIMHRQDACIANGRPDLVAYCAQ